MVSTCGQQYLIIVTEITCPNFTEMRQNGAPLVKSGDKLTPRRRPDLFIVLIDES